MGCKNSTFKGFDANDLQMFCKLPEARFYKKILCKIRCKMFHKILQKKPSARSLCLRSILPPASCVTSFARILPLASCVTSFARILPPASKNYFLFFFLLISGPKRSPPSCLPGLSVLTSLGPLFKSSQVRSGLCLAKRREALKTMGQ